MTEDRNKIEGGDNHSLRLGAFTLHALVGQGGMGEVWRATHRDGMDSVAIKLLAGDRANDERFAEAFLSEVRAVSKLLHSMIINVIDYGHVSAQEAADSNGRLSKGSQWLAMEYADSGTLTKHCGKLGWHQIRKILFQLLDALGHAHARGVIHRDIKPGNVMLRGPGDPPAEMVLTDFGLAHIWSNDEKPLLESGWLGTTSFMAPEQFDPNTDRIGSWTDIYGFACLAWALITGKAPFSSFDTPDEIRVGHLTLEPPEFTPKMDVPSGVEQWLRGLLIKDPLLRPAWSAEVAADLLAVDRGCSAPIQPPNIPLDWIEDSLGVLTDRPRLVGAGAGLHGIRAIPLVGRESERTKMWEALREVEQEGVAQAVILEGVVGSGKSRLAKWIQEEAYRRGAAVCMTAVHSALPAIGDGLEAMLRRHPLAASSLPVNQSNSTPDRYRLIAEEIKRLSGVGVTSSRKRLVVIWLDNVQWGIDSLGFVKYLLDNPMGEESSTLFVLTVRHEALLTERVIGRVVQGLCDHKLCRRIEIGALPKEQRGMLVKELLSLEPGLAGELEERTGGNPLYTMQLVGDWVERDHLEQGDNGYKLKKGVKIELPDTLHQLWEQRIERATRGLGDDDRRALELAGLLGQEIDNSAWHRLCHKLGITISGDLLKSITSAGLAEVRNAEHWSFVHAMVSESLVRAASEGDSWASYNLACVELLTESDNEEAESARIGRHLVAAKNCEKSLSYLLAGAEQHRDSSDYHQADQLLDLREEALRSLSVPEGDRRWVEGWLVRAKIARVETNLTLSKELVARAEAASVAGEWGDLFRKSLREKAYNALTLGETTEAFECIKSLRTEAKDADDFEVLAACDLIMITVSMSRGEDDKALRFARSARSIFISLDDKIGLGQSYRGSGWVLLSKGRYAAAREDLAMAKEMFEESGLKYGTAEVLNDIGESYRLEGSYGIAEQLYRRSILLSQATGASLTLTPRVNLGLTLMELDQLEEARRVLEVCLKASRTQRRRAYEAALHVYLADCVSRQKDWRHCEAHLLWGGMLLSEVDQVSRENAIVFERTADTALAAGNYRVAQSAYDLSVEQLRSSGDAELVARVRGKREDLKNRNVR